MEQRLSQEVFYGSAIAALCGLLFGLLLHIPWEKHPGGPQILFSRAEAAELPRVDAENLVAAASTDRQVEVADEDVSHVTPDPLPVTRLRPEMFDVQPAAAGDDEREDIDDVAADDAPQASSHDLD